ncbi:MAG: DUF131 domain-containing protein [Sulfolobaceae archaeon]|nr:DUF131 domain-containing protein [Sulfolobaceae archaeon]
MNYVSLLLLGGILIIFIGFILIFIGALIEGEKNSSNTQENKTQAGGIIFIGPIPIVFGSSKEITKWMLIIALIIAIILIVLYIL